MNGLEYQVSVTATYERVIELRVTLRAEFGTRSFCTVRGMENLDYDYNYGYWNDPGLCESSNKISITPRMIAALVAFARENGWSPEFNKSNLELVITNDPAKPLVENFKTLTTGSDAEST